MSKSAFLILILLQAAYVDSKGQMDAAMLKADLEPHTIYGRRYPFQRNLSFANYHTSKLRRTVGSFLQPGTINPLNKILMIEGVPLQRKERYRNKDVFSFNLNSRNGVLVEVACRALLSVREKFALLRQQDSSFWGATNTDLFIASIVSSAATTNQWTVLAANLNATQRAPQKGRLFSEKEEVSFELTDLLLREANHSGKQEKNFMAVNRVYAFTYKGRTVAAVSVKAADRKWWIHKDLNADLRDAIAATAAALTIRRNLYR